MQTPNLSIPQLLTIPPLTALDAIIGATQPGGVQQWIKAELQTGRATLDDVKYLYKTIIGSLGMIEIASAATTQEDFILDSAQKIERAEAVNQLYCYVMKQPTSIMTYDRQGTEDIQIVLLGGYRKENIFGHIFQVKFNLTAGFRWDMTWEEKTNRPYWDYGQADQWTDLTKTKGVFYFMPFNKAIDRKLTGDVLVFDDPGIELRTEETTRTLEFRITLCQDDKSYHEILAKQVLKTKDGKVKEMSFKLV